MRTVGASAFGRQFQALVTNTFELIFGLRRERWDGAGWRWVGEERNSMTEFQILGQLSRKYAKVHIMRDSVGVWATIVDVHLHTYHHYKNSGTCRQEAEDEEITPETVAPTDSYYYRYFSVFAYLPPVQINAYRDTMGTSRRRQGGLQVRRPVRFLKICQ